MSRCCRIRHYEIKAPPPVRRRGGGYAGPSLAHYTSGLFAAPWLGYRPLPRSVDDLEADWTAAATPFNLPVMTLRIGSIVIGAADVRRGVQFWCAALAYRLREEPEPEWAVLVPASGEAPNVSLAKTAASPRRHGLPGRPCRGRDTDPAWDSPAHALVRCSELTLQVDFLDARPHAQGDGQLRRKERSTI